jgi:hypothetical protein
MFSPRLAPRINDHVVIGREFITQRNQLAARFCERGGYNEIHDFCKELTLCSRGHALFHDREWFHVYCFESAADRAHACRHPLDRWQAHAEDDAVGTSSSLGERRKDRLFDL